MLITVDNLAQRYHLLPSECMERATTFDLYVMDIGSRYAVIREQKRNGTYIKPTPKLSQEQMVAMLQKVKK